jgi:hypothetical protein
MLTVIDGTHELCTGVRLHLAPGHTPGRAWASGSSRRASRLRDRRRCAADARPRDDAATAASRARAACGWQT